MFVAKSRDQTKRRVILTRHLIGGDGGTSVTTSWVVWECLVLPVRSMIVHYEGTRRTIVLELGNHSVYSNWGTTQTMMVVPVVVMETIPVTKSI